jgi:hypothetical protein
MKPQFALLVTVVVLARREWAILAGGVASALIQFAVTAAVLGRGSILQYAALVPNLPSMQAALEPAPELLHSITALTNLLPRPFSGVAWLLCCAWVSIMVVQIWRSPHPTAVRMAALVIGSVLVNPHVNVYDLTVTALPLVWIAGWLTTTDTAVSAGQRRCWWTSIYLYFGLVLLPSAHLIAAQGSVLVMLWYLLALNRARTGEEMRGVGRAIA